jgi:hypothetical protein
VAAVLAGARCRRHALIRQGDVTGLPGRAGCDDPHELLTAALGAMVDAAAREALPDGLSLTPPRRRRRPKRLDVAETWLTALCSPDARFDADPDEIDILAEALHSWDEVGTGHTGPARATFRLAEATTGPRADELGVDELGADKQDADEHGEDGGWWRLEFLPARHRERFPAGPSCPR